MALLLLRVPLAIAFLFFMRFDRAYLWIIANGYVINGKKFSNEK